VERAARIGEAKIVAAAAVAVELERDSADGSPVAELPKEHAEQAVVVADALVVVVEQAVELAEQVVAEHAQVGVVVADAVEAEVVAALEVQREQQCLDADGAFQFEEGKLGSTKDCFCCTNHVREYLPSSHSLQQKRLCNDRKRFAKYQRDPKPVCRIPLPCKL
jgi:hypothetical protein